MPQNAAEGLKVLAQSLIAPSQGPGLGPSSLMMLVMKMLEERGGGRVFSTESGTCGLVVIVAGVPLSAASWCGSLVWRLACSSCS